MVDLAHAPSALRSRWPATTSHSLSKVVDESGGASDTERPSLPEKDVTCDGERHQNTEVNSSPLGEVGSPPPLRVSHQDNVDSNTQAEETCVSLSQVKRSISKFATDNFYF